ncbi:RRP12-like protein [Tigriopus californicus]|uniref:RRP12-like protein n=1 Tax=Tigriopus californicus TaxID=6832 RepID=UPI0027D9D558|nr:RRP12-like protein [Tigriopus californicus]
MGKFRVRSKSAKKGQRWARGQSGQSNPVKHRHRDAAKSRSWGGTSASGRSAANDSPWAAGPGKLTAESLLKHDALSGDAVMSSMPIDDDDAVSLGQTAKTFETFASDWTQCSHQSFHRLMRRFNANNPQHKEMLAILAAITELIKEKGGEESSTEYFAALLATLESTDTLEALSAVLTLVSMVIKTVPAEVLQAKFGVVSKLLLDLLAQQSEAGQSTSVVRALIGCLSVLLRAQSLFTWKQSSTHQVYHSVMAFITHPKPKVRKAGQRAITSILRGSWIMTQTNAPSFHPMIGATMKECQSNLNLNTEIKSVMYTLALMKEIIGVAPQSQVKASCDLVLSLLQSKAHPNINTCGMQMLYGLFETRPNPSVLSSDLNARLVTAIYDFKPSVNDAQPFISWLTVLQEGLLNLNQLDPNLCWAHLPKFYTEAKKGWEADLKHVNVAATTAMKAIAIECIKPQAAVMATQANMTEVFVKIFAQIKDGFSYQYHASYSQVLHLLSIVFDVAGEEFPAITGAILPELAERRNSENFAFTNELDYVVGKAVRKLGPKMVLSFIDLQIKGDDNPRSGFPRSWLLVVMRGNIQNTELGFFIDYFYPLAEKCRLRSHRCLNQDDRFGHKIFQMLELQMWDLLPGFCNGARDLEESFKVIARVLGEQLKVRKELRMNIMASLRQIILKTADKEEDRLTIARYAKNYLPILCNIYTTPSVGSEEADQRLATFETIKQFLRIAPSDLIYSMFDSTFELYQSESGFMREATLDLLRAELCYQDIPRIQKLFDAVVGNLASTDHTQQKKAYRVLEEICGSSSESCSEFISLNLESIQAVFLKSLSNASPTSRASRLSSLTHIARKLKVEQIPFLYQVIPECVLCIKATNEKARANAFNLILVIAEILLRLKSEGSDVVIREYMEVLVAGLAGSASLIHCTMLAISRVFYEFKDMFPESVADWLAEKVCLLLTNREREVVGSALSFLQVFVQVNPVAQTTKHVPQIITSLITMTEDCKRCYRLKTRYLLDRIVRKFGYDFVLSMVPKDDVLTLNRLKNIRKKQMQQKRRKDGAEPGESDDDDDDLEFNIKSKSKTMEDILQDSDSDLEDTMDTDSEARSAKRNKKKKTKGASVAFITDNDEGIVDFLDPSAAQKVSSVRPKTNAERD